MISPRRLAVVTELCSCAPISNALADGQHSERCRLRPLFEQLVTAGRLGNKTGSGVNDYAR